MVSSQHFFRLPSRMQVTKTFWGTHAYWAPQSKGNIHRRFILLRRCIAFSRIGCLRWTLRQRRVPYSSLWILWVLWDVMDLETINGANMQASHDQSDYSSRFEAKKCDTTMLSRNFTCGTTCIMPHGIIVARI